MKPNSDDPMAAPPPDPVLALYPASARPRSAVVPIGNAGGGSGASLWRFDSELGKFVVRGWPPDGPSAERLATVHGWLGDLAGLDFISRPIPTGDGRTAVPWLGRLWDVSPWLDGQADPARPPRTGRLVAAADGLARVHRRLADRCRNQPSPGLLARLDEARWWLGVGLDQIKTQAGPEPDPAILATARTWARLARPGLVGLVEWLRRDGQNPLPTQPVFRDARPDHVLFIDDRLTGLVDYGAMGVDSVAADLGRYLAGAVGPDRTARAAFLRAYTVTRPLTPAESASIGLFEASAAWLGPARWVRWSLLDRRRFDDPAAVRRGLDAALGRLREWVAAGTDRIRS